MAPTNGATKPARITARRAPSKVIPVLPLNYPQRPVNKLPSAPPKPSPLAEVQPHSQVVDSKEEKMAEAESQGASPKQPLVDTTNGYTTAPAAIAAEKPAPVEPSSEPLAPSAALSTGTPTVIADPADHHVVSPTPTRPESSKLAASADSSVPGSVRAVHTSQPPLSFRHAVHQAHPSNGSLIFGGFQDSNASSPAPLSGGPFPTPNMIGPFHYPAAPPVDGYGRPIIVSPSFDGFTPSMISHHGPPTPHSIHGSQSSAQAEGHGFGPWITNNNNHPADPTGQLPVPAHFMNPYASPAAPPANAGQFEYETTMSFLRSVVDTGAFNDCFLDMQFPEPVQYQDHPDHHRLRQYLRIPAHRMVLARSPTLRNLMKAQHVECGGVVLLELHGEYMRSDVVHFVIRTLYGWPIGDGIPPSDLTVRDVRDDFRLALSYIDASQYLQVGWVHSAAVRRAVGLLRWDTIDLAADFILPRAVLSPRGNESLIPLEDCSIHGLLRHFLVFIVKNFPKDFVLDVNASGGFSRLPIPSIQSPKSPTVPNGTPNGSLNGITNGNHVRQPSGSQTNLSRGQRVSTNPRLSQIKFGDISPPERNGSASPDTARSQRSPSASDTILSRILLNLPYEHLKYVLEAPDLGAGTPGGEIPHAARQPMINDIIFEREARRLRTLERPQPQLQVFQDTLDKAAAPLVVNQIGDFLVNNMGHKEEVCPGDIPFLVHTWTPAASGSASA